MKPWIPWLLAGVLAVAFTFALKGCSHERTLRKQADADVASQESRLKELGLAYTHMAKSHHNENVNSNESNKTIIKRKIKMPDGTLIEESEIANWVLRGSMSRTDDLREPVVPPQPPRTMPPVPPQEPVQRSPWEMGAGIGYDGHLSGMGLIGRKLAGPWGVALAVVLPRPAGYALLTLQTR